jgi:cytochrome c556
VWFDDPLAVVADERPVASSAETGSTAPTTHQAVPNRSPDDPHVLAAGRDWSALIAIEILDDEVKRIHNALKQSLQSAGRYNQQFEDVQVHGAALAALAEIAAQHPAQTAWQSNARYVRDLGARIEEQAQERGRAAFDGVRLPFDRLLDLLGAGRPTDLDEPDADAEFAERADRGGLMKRMESALEWLRQNKSTEDGFAKDADDTLHETAVLAALSAVVATGGYTSADEPQYNAHIAALIEANFELTEAVQAKNFQNFSQALARVEKKCNDCHQEYRFADEF